MQCLIPWEGLVSDSIRMVSARVMKCNPNQMLKKTCFTLSYFFLQIQRALISMTKRSSQNFISLPALMYQTLFCQCVCASFKHRVNRKKLPWHIWQPMWCFQGSILWFLQCFCWELAWFCVWRCCVNFMCKEVARFFSLIHSGYMIYFLEVAWVFFAKRLHEFFC